MTRQLKTGFLLALQFFSVIPVKKQLPMEKEYITTMYAMLPLLGLLFGSVLASTVWLLRDATDISSLLLGFIVVLIGMVMTGGLHMDGLADTGDAYFSYQDRDKRLAIMGDPRIGAFGAMVLVVAIVGKIILVAEIINEVSFLWILLVPVFSRIGLLGLFSTTKPAKPDGVAAFFQQRTNHKKLRLLAIIATVVNVALLIASMGNGNALLIVVVVILVSWLYRIWCLRNFGGVTGDLLGAYVEGVEILVWMTFLFFV
ncbi:adenosylcobinamide-GDP ribazoletransferase [Planococcus donghaensis]|uniref:Adenosylcobinamide-GDP ribazoletransferase n=1 Tax=Planococcus donghaensis TaxID=414778 RepID=A0A1C7EFC5_9BACL|nr:adenosylcobinamide-GDP ribazoletransferase [Planococcus donghaensis]ANU22381.1 cobalamin 5'-phosphate synthase [Planococcus donghaensis]